MLWEQDGVGMFVTPLPVVALLLTARFSPLTIVPVLLLQVVAVSPFLALVPLSRKFANAPRVYRGRTLPRSCEEIHRRRVAKKQAFCRQRRSRRDRLSLMPTPSR